MLIVYAFATLILIVLFIFSAEANHWHSMGDNGIHFLLYYLYMDLLIQSYIHCFMHR